MGAKNKIRTENKTNCVPTRAPTRDQPISFPGRNDKQDAKEK